MHFELTGATIIPHKWVPITPITPIFAPWTLIIRKVWKKTKKPILTIGGECAITRKITKKRAKNNL